MKIIYKTNAVYTTESMTKWYFGAEFVKAMTDSAKQINKKSDEIVFRFWKDGTGYLTVEFH